ncbi:hypothetical protein HBI56_096860 [Parastagonospora nodorum]|uniref:Uncharacterized protein n=2 Tax=Phaeosphaeria nodorum (strain SN15 / ATCC MYA-4574 / FGSC 10173) TaxID=321614 RepID=Q0UUY1_PHANO|nr:hypothetical protein SNOG_04433 [Parastagonospora nodorum SN15]KAH3914662.1 hypothetical protein HBH56_092230 [Parastagonospora nodorum]EAT88193.1 hypothetical protein SNOG_04433 [Parastagonospora nodorum SN15]KAH3936334.1 hypothetical protein HBH54_026880 [Parastagonospora nodorum]KAH3957685.1 hypothetical protein HBH51_221770 [Parastagonospora nodorum]KAH3989689.1 hypothetical protein HBH52_016420 [Parastagonospora nodorum]
MVFRGPPTLTPNAECLAIMQANQQNSPLLRLPAELRQMVYNYALDTNSAASPGTLCRASRQLFAETSEDYFKQNFIVQYLQTHHYEDLEELERHIKHLGPDQRGGFRELILNNKVLLQLRQLKEDECLLSHFPNLHCISLRSQVGVAEDMLDYARQWSEFLRPRLGSSVCYRLQFKWNPI